MYHVAKYRYPTLLKSHNSLDRLPAQPKKNLSESKLVKMVHGNLHRKKPVQLSYPKVANVMTLLAQSHHHNQNNHHNDQQETALNYPLMVPMLRKIKSQFHDYQQQSYRQNHQSYLLQIMNHTGQNI